MVQKSDAPKTLDYFLHNVGVPTILHTDGAKELTKGEWERKCNKSSIIQTTTEPHSP